MGDKVTGRGRRRGTSSAGPEAVDWVLRIDVLGELARVGTRRGRARGKLWVDILGLRERVTGGRWRKRDGEAVVVAGEGREGERGERFVVPPRALLDDFCSRTIGTLVLVNRIRFLRVVDRVQGTSAIRRLAGVIDELEVLVFVERIIVVALLVVRFGTSRRRRRRRRVATSDGDVAISIDARVVHGRTVASAIVAAREFLRAVRARDWQGDPKQEGQQGGPGERDEHSTYIHGCRGDSCGEIAC